MATRIVIMPKRRPSPYVPPVSSWQVIALLLLSGCIIDSGSGGLRVVLCGDSTMARYAGEGTVVGWGEVLPKYLNKSTAVFNHGIPGSTAKSFLNEAMEHAIASHSDIAIIQFGHNNGEIAEESQALDTLLDQFQANGTSVILVTPMESRIRSLLYPALDSVLRNAAARHHVPLVPLDSLSHIAWMRVPDDSIGEYFKDMIHLTGNGADRIASMIVPRLISIEPSLKP
jgi:lysophospholipase L1-like esterase